MKITFKPQKFRSETRYVIDRANEIVVDYEQRGYRLSLRQLYYQMVKENFIPNDQKEYKKLSATLTNARYAGEMSWNSLSDRLRYPRKKTEWYSPNDALETLIRQYQVTRMEGQRVKIEVMVEKDAVSEIIQPICERYGIALNVNRGFSSSTAVFDIARRSVDFIIYAGDFDPSGLAMIEDIENRLETFESETEVIPIAITQEQIAKYNFPPNPAKMTDSRAKEFVSRYGNKSYELDALAPEVLEEILIQKIESIIDLGLYNSRLRKEAKDIEQLKNLLV